MAGPGQPLPALVVPLVHLVARHQGQGAGQPPVGQGDEGTGGAPQGRGDARHQLGLDAVAGQVQRLLAAPAKHQGVPSLETHHPLACAGQGQQQGVDLLLGRARLPAALAHVEAGRPPGNTGQDLAPHQAVIDHHLRRLQTLQGAQGQQLEGAGPRSHQTDLAHFTLLVSWQRAKRMPGKHV